MEGKIKTLKDKGFGFIEVEDKEKDIFFHMNDLSGVKFEDLKEGDTLSFDLEENDKGLSAVNVTLAE
jgi:CspA family cold shock protein